MVRIEAIYNQSFYDDDESGNRTLIQQQIFPPSWETMPWMSTYTRIDWLLFILIALIII